LHSSEEEVRDVPISALELTNGLPIKPEEAVMDTEVVWLYKGKTPHKATIVGTRKGTIPPTGNPKETPTSTPPTSPTKTEFHVINDSVEERDKLDDSSLDDSGSEEGIVYVEVIIPVL